MEDEQEITERYNKDRGLIEIRCGRCGNTEEVPIRMRERHEYGLGLPPWIAARAARRFTRGSGGDCRHRGRVIWNELVCCECGNMSTQDD